MYVVVTINVNAGTTYDFSVGGSKMGFYGFEFVPDVTISLNASGFATYSTSYDFTVSGATANGQRVAQPTKGLYIVNGRKVAIK